MVHAGSIALGKAAADNLPETAIGIIAGILLFGFAIWTPRGDRITGDETRKRGRLGPIAVVTVAFFVAELGD